MLNICSSTKRDCSYKIQPLLANSNRLRLTINNLYICSHLIQILYQFQYVFSKTSGTPCITDKFLSGQSSTFSRADSVTAKRYHFNILNRLETYNSCSASHYLKSAYRFCNKTIYFLTSVQANI